MLTRLRVSGFKNLVDVDVRFGPFNCIAGANGVGKSNLFDAIRFLSALADHPFNEAAQLALRDQSATGDIRQLFHRVGDQYADEISFDVEMIIPRAGIDDLGQSVEASATHLRYGLTLKTHNSSNGNGDLASLDVNREELSAIDGSECGFDHSREWRESLLSGIEVKPDSDLISTREPNETDPSLIVLLDEEFVVELFREMQYVKARPARLFPLANLRRTVLSSINRLDYPTAMLARREMQSWRVFQLDPLALRRSSPRTVSEPRLQPDGSNLAAALYRLANRDGDPERVYAQISSRLAELLDDVRRVWVDHDDVRNLLTLMVEDRYGTVYPASALSDGTLRFLALAVMSLDPTSGGVVCLEEPENGVHPARIPALLRLLQDAAVDTSFAVDEDNPLRQVIINTHSPSVVQQVPDDSLLLADLVPAQSAGGAVTKGLRFSALRDTWRTKSQAHSEAAFGELLDYLAPPVLENENGSAPARPRVIDREDIRRILSPTVE